MAQQTSWSGLETQTVLFVHGSIHVGCRRETSTWLCLIVANEWFAPDVTDTSIGLEMAGPDVTNLLKTDRTWFD